MGVLSDVSYVRSPVHLIGCVFGAISLSLFTSVSIHDAAHQKTVALKFLLTTF